MCSEKVEVFQMSSLLTNKLSLENTWCKVTDIERFHFTLFVKWSTLMRLIGCHLTSKISDIKKLLFSFPSPSTCLHCDLNGVEEFKAITYFCFHFCLSSCDYVRRTLTLFHLGCLELQALKSLRSKVEFTFLLSLRILTFPQLVITQLQKPSLPFMSV